MTNRIYITRRFIRILKVSTLCSATHVLWPPEGNPGDAGHLLQAQTEESLARLTLRARLDLVKSSLGGRVLLVVVVMVVIMIVVIVLVLVVGMDFLDSGRHLDGGESASGDATRGSSKRRGSHPSSCNVKMTDYAVSADR